MKTIHYLIFFLLLLATTACQKEDFLLQGTYDLEIDYAVFFDKNTLEIRFESLEDRRRPIGTLPPEGVATVGLFIIQNDELIELDLTLDSMGNGSESPVLTSAYGNFKIKLKEVNPYPDHSVVDPTPYTIVFDLIGI